MTDSVAPKRTTRLQRIVQLDDVPEPKWYTMVARTIVGGLLFAVGGGLLYVAVRGYLETRELSLWLLGVGVCFMVGGVAAWSTQLVIGIGMAMLTPYKAWLRARATDGQGT